MERLWAPWRKEFILKGKELGCIFCDLPNQKADRRNLILHRDSSCYVILNRFPYTNGHLMIVPFRHLAELDELSIKESNQMWDLAQKSVIILRKLYRPQGFNIGMNLGRSAGAGIVDHLHLHVVPRWSGDNNFMPVVGNTKIYSISLEDTYRELLGGFKSTRPKKLARRRV